MNLSLQSINIPGYTKRIPIVDNYDDRGCLMKQTSIHDDGCGLIDDDTASEYMVLYL